MRFGSLFSGIGGLDLGLERAGMRCAWQAEIDPYAREVLEKHWPNVFKYDDVRHVHGADVAGTVDLICGGFPCQDISVAGKGKGLAGERSGLWREYARIVDEVRPAWVLIENVPALRTRGLRTVLGDLHACGYDAEWDGVSASALGAPHQRDRLFVIAYARRSRLEGQRQKPRVFGPELSAPRRSSWWAAEPEVDRVVHGSTTGLDFVDRIRCQGNAVVPQVAEYVGRLIMAAAAT